MSTTKTTLFAKAKATAPKATGAKTKEKVVVEVDLGDKLFELQETREQIAILEAKEQMLAGDIKPVAREEYLKLMKIKKAKPESFIMSSENGKILVIMQDKYLKVTDEKEKTLIDNELGDLIDEKTTFSFNPELLEKYEKQISDAISKMKIPDEDKAAMIEATVVKSVKKGTLDTLPTYKNPDLVFTLIEPVVQLKNQA